jgi:hypothetical protein
MTLKLFIGTPMYGGMCTEPYMHSMLTAAAHMTTQNIQFGLSTISNESFIIRARDKMVSFFLETDCTHLFFIDADIEFQPEDLIRLPNHNLDMVCGAYPLKEYRFDNATNQPFPTGQHLKTELTQYVVEPEFVYDENNVAVGVKTHNNFIKLRNAGTGFMCIRRNVIEQMTQYYKETICQHANGGPTFYGLFHPFIDDGLYLSEDYAFCRRWQNLGGEVWLDPKVKLSHFGSHLFEGRELI